MRLCLICDAWKHHSAHSGYHQLLRYLDGEVCERGALYRFFHRFPKAFGPSFPDVFERWSLPYHSARELELAALRLFSGPAIYHFLYGENTVRLLPYIKGRSRIVATFHQPCSTFSRATRFLKMLSRLDAIVVLARHQVDFFAQFAAPQKVFFVPHGIDTARFTPSENGRPKEPMCLFVGNWLRSFETMREIAQKMQRLRPDVKFLAVTNQMNWRHFEGLENVRCLTRISEDELLGLYQRASLLVQPLDGATANSALLEAMACGLPSVVNRVGGVADYVDEKCARILPKKADAAAFVDGIIELLENEGRRKAMSAAARRRGEEFDWRSVARTMESVYRFVEEGGK
jgi:glycosyltransferase involved in cell wall biosynthesis